MLKKKYAMEWLLFLLITSVVIGLFAVEQAIMSYYTYQEDHQALAEEMIGIQKILATGLSDALWDYDLDQVRALVSGAIGLVEVVEIEVFDASFGQVYLEQEALGKKDDYVVITQEVSRNDEIIGQVKLTYTKHFQRNRFKRDLLLSLIFMLFTLIVLMKLIKKIISYTIAPLHDLENLAKKIGTDEEVEITIDAKTLEIDALAKSMGHMQKRIESSQQDLASLNLHLEDLVKERTQELTRSNQELKVLLGQLEDQEKSLKKAREQELVNKLVAGLGHEVNTPLGTAVTLTSFLKVLLKKITSGEADQEEIKLCQESLLKLEDHLDYVAKLMEQFRSLQIGTDPEARMEIDLLSYLDRALEVVTKYYPLPPSYELKGQRPLFVTLNPLLLLEIIKQLVENSLVHSGLSPDKLQLEVKVDINNNQVMLHYADNGKGADQSFAQHAFEPFSKESLKTPGVGLGLTIVNNLVTFGLKGNLRYEQREKGFGILIIFMAKQG